MSRKFIKSIKSKVMKNKNHKCSKFQVPCFKKNGFTLLEMIFAIGLFSMVITVVMGVFVKSSQIQRKVIELHTIQREGNFMIEMMSREIRTATVMDVDQEGNNNSSVEFTNYVGDTVKYCRANAGGFCTEDDSGDYLTRRVNGVNQIVSSSNIKIDSLKFYVPDDFNVSQPMVTISMTVKPAASQHNTEISLQSSVALRVY